MFGNMLSGPFGTTRNKRFNWALQKKGQHFKALFHNCVRKSSMKRRYFAFAKWSTVAKNVISPSMHDIWNMRLCFKTTITCFEILIGSILNNSGDLMSISFCLFVKDSVHILIFDLFRQLKNVPYFFVRTIEMKKQGRSLYHWPPDRWADKPTNVSQHKMHQNQP